MMEEGERESRRGASSFVFPFFSSTCLLLLLLNLNLRIPYRLSVTPSLAFLSAGTGGAVTAEEEAEAKTLPRCWSERRWLVGEEIAAAGDPCCCHRLPPLRAKPRMAAAMSEEDEEEPTIFLAATSG